MPILISKSGLPVYNATLLGQVSAEKSTFVWDQYTEIRNGYKVAVTAINDHGCIGTEGNFIIHSAPLDITEPVVHNVVRH